MALPHVAQGDPHVAAHNAERDAIDAAQSYAVQRINHVGTQSADTLTDGTTGKVYTATEKTKLAGVASGATANSPDATLLARANHTGTQPASTVTGLAPVATSGAYSDLSGKPTTSVDVVTYSGNLGAARPSTPVVIWSNFPTQPTNMIDGDIWIDPTTGGVVLSGAGAPTSSDGNNGDFWIRTSNSTLYGPKTAGAWAAGVSLIGAAGQGVPTGGTTAQVLAKNSNTDYDTHWVDQTGGGGGGSYTPDWYYKLPAGAVAATFDRSQAVSGNLVVTSGTLYVAAIVLRAGAVINNLNCRVGSTAFSAVTHSWMLLADASRVVLRRSADDTTTPSGTQVSKSFAMTSAYTVPTTGLYYLGMMWAGSGLGSIYAHAASANTGPLIPPILFGTSDTGQTTPPAEGATVGALTAIANEIYGWAA